MDADHISIAELFENAETFIDEDRTIETRGWVYRTRSSGRLVFLVLRDSSGYIQATVFKGNVENTLFKQVKKLLIESSIKIKGKLAKDERAPGGYELQVSDVEIVHAAEVFPITKDQSEEFLMANRHLWLRSRELTTAFRIRSTLFQMFRQFWREKGYYEINGPIFQTGSCEGGSTLFELDYTKDVKVNLTQSWQLYAEAMIYSLENIFAIAPTFRAEKSRTRRHVSEFWMAEAESAWCSNREMMDLEEEMVVYLIQKTIEHHRKDLEHFERDISFLEKIETPFEVYRYQEVLDMLERKGISLEWGANLGYAEEKALTEDKTQPFFITHFPREKGFYHRPDPQEQRALLCHDLLAPEGYGEIIGGGERIWEKELLQERLGESDMDPEDYAWYVDLRRFGSVPHSGFGLGMERLLTWIIGTDHIKNVIPFPRTMRWYYP